MKNIFEQPKVQCSIVTPPAPSTTPGSVVVFVILLMYIYKDKDNCCFLYASIYFDCMHLCTVQHTFT